MLTARQLPINASAADEVKSGEWPDSDELDWKCIKVLVVIPISRHFGSERF